MRSSWRAATPSHYGVFYDRHLGVVRSYVASRVRQPELMFDLVAETFARALENRAQFDPARGPAVGWLIGIARHLIIDSVRRGQVEAASRVRLGWRRWSSMTSSWRGSSSLAGTTCAPRSGRSPPISARRCFGGRAG